MIGSCCFCADRNFYEILNVPKDADLRDIRHAYHKILRNRDRREDRHRPTRHFQDVLHAYQVLSDEKKRKIYDKFGERGLREGMNLPVEEEESGEVSVNKMTSPEKNTISQSSLNDYNGPTTFQALMMVVGIIVLVVFFMKRSSKSKTSVTPSTPKEDVYWDKVL
ncbi:hypothetical protein C9374_012467 [Naegleria lovaniensis]|uniref:J domain-containing protein n=1 Tax=Naegleria lovaniensis TaxID=51637 RepID=A0AA88KVZ1_NAELO|nr:uncharacterized protein C9374_012467 [Naegleria lovaniensis]KAG2392215.1 hypothetical protein C9374_012467 [Naegleria lovaniensis]